MGIEKNMQHLFTSYSLLLQIKTVYLHHILYQNYKMAALQDPSSSALAH